MSADGVTGKEIAPWVGLLLSAYPASGDLVPIAIAGFIGSGIAISLQPKVSTKKSYLMLARGVGMSILFGSGVSVIVSAYTHVSVLPILVPVSGAIALFTEPVLLGSKTWVPEAISMILRTLTGGGR